MGVNLQMINILDFAVRQVSTTGWYGVKMIELGNQRLRPGFTSCGTMKTYAQRKGVYHVSIDLNGKDGALEYDLSKPIEAFDSKFDVVTNFGTSEHVKDQREVFANMHRFIRIDGVAVHVVPKVGHYKDHCEYHYEEKFFTDLAEANNYKILDLADMPNGTEFLVHSILKKQDSKEFVWPSHWFQ